MSDVINLANKMNCFSDLWSPRVIAEMNDYQFKLVKIAGDFVWHDHPETDEVFLVIKGEMQIDFEDGPVTLQSGEMIVVPKGKRHKPFAENECQVMVIEPRGVINTGDAPSDKTYANDVWI